jgi:hypothetical protein
LTLLGRFQIHAAMPRPSCAWCRLPYSSVFRKLWRLLEYID